MASRQFEHLHEQSLQSLRAMVPAGCPVFVQRHPAGFVAMTHDERDSQCGRFQVVAAWITGFTTAWSRITREHR